MKKTRLEIKDQVNVKFHGLEPQVRKKIVEKLKFMVPYARHLPAYKLGRWDGKISFATAGGGTYLNLLDRVLPIVIDAGYDVEIDDQRIDLDFAFPQVTEDFLDAVWPDGHPMAGQPILLRDHQMTAIENYFNNPQSLQSIATGAGKTIITACLAKACEPYGRTLTIVPSKSLVEQTEEDFKNVGLDTGVWFGDRKDADHRHLVTTWQSMNLMAKKSREGVEGVDFQAFVDGVVSVVVDECHILKGNEIRDLLAGPLAHIPIRWGMSGTIPREDFEYLNLLAAIGHVVGEVRSDELQAKGVLAGCHIDILQIRDDVEYKDYHDEREFLATTQKRLSALALEIQSLTSEGNTLILVDRVDTGRILNDLIPDSTFIYGDTKQSIRRTEYKEVNQGNNRVLIATYGVAAVGINIPRLFNLVLIEAGKSPIRVLQSLGRVLRKAEDKEFANIYDICSTARFSARHLTKRKALYKEAGFNFKVKKIKLRGW